MSDEPLGKRIDALMKRQGSPRAAGEVPVLTEVVSDERAPRRTVDSPALEALARELERAVLERLGPEVASRDRGEDRAHAEHGARPGARQACAPSSPSA